MKYEYTIWGIKVQSNKEIDFNDSKIKFALVESRAEIEKHGLNTSIYRLTDSNKLIAYPEDDKIDEFIRLEKENGIDSLGFVVVDLNDSN